MRAGGSEEGEKREVRRDARWSGSSGLRDGNAVGALFIPTKVDEVLAVSGFDLITRRRAGKEKEPERSAQLTIRARLRSCHLFALI